MIGKILMRLGIVIYIVMSGIDKFVYHIPNMVYIPIAVLGISLILIGFFQNKRAGAASDLSGG